MAQINKCLVLVEPTFTKMTHYGTHCPFSLSLSPSSSFSLLSLAVAHTNNRWSKASVQFKTLREREERRESRQWSLAEEANSKSAETLNRHGRLHEGDDGPQNPSYSHSREEGRPRQDPGTTQLYPHFRFLSISLILLRNFPFGSSETSLGADPKLEIWAFCFVNRRSWCWLWSLVVSSSTVLKFANLKFK